MPKPVVPEIEVLHAAMVLRVLGDLDGGLVVDVERTRTDREPHLCEEIAHPESLLSRCNSRDVLRFSGRQRLNGLQVDLGNVCQTRGQRSLNFRVRIGKPIPRPSTPSKCPL